MSQETETTNQLLRVVVALLLEESKALPKLKQKIEFLDRSGLKPAEIARIVGRTGNLVNKELSGIRKARR